ncbi:MAG TPA: GGDEF domain-containing protein [Candidatus Limnocylindrales bacterium]|nr:GGDEF domain-containing protein [Candidatus Limnocylindrales bacterium]
MSSGESAVRRAFVEAARLLARGGDLDQRLAGIAAQAALATAAESAAVYLLDGATGGLTAAGGDAPEAAPTGAAQEEAGGPLLDAARTRRATFTELAPGGPWGGASVLAAVPLVTLDATGTEQVEGVLAAAYPARPADSDAVLEDLGALADLAATAVRSSRLEGAVAERHDWFERLAHTDPLTGLANRRTFERMLELELARSVRQGSSISVALFDIDGLAEICRVHGADVGDDVLRRVASVLADTVRLVDTVARFGGDEFAVLAPGSAGRAVAQRVIDAVAALDPLDGGETITLGVGVARFPEDGTTSEALLGAAEDALRAAKLQGPGSLTAREG